MSQVPFTISATHAGFGRCDGLLRIEEECLQFEFQVKVAGLIKSEIKVLDVPLSDIAAIEFKGGWFATRILVQFKSLVHTQDFPRADGTEVTLELRRRDRESAKNLVKEAKMGLIASSLDDMLEMTDQALR